MTDIDAGGNIATLTDQVRELPPQRNLIAFQAALDGTLPDDQNMPSGIGQRAYRTPVAQTIRFNLCLPEIAAGGGEGEKVAVVPVPEAAMHEDDGAMLRQDNVRRARQGAHMQAETEPEREKQFTHQQFRAGVAAPDRAHVFAAALRAVYIGHRLRRQLLLRCLTALRLEYPAFHERGDCGEDADHDGVTELFVGLGIGYRDSE